MKPGVGRLKVGAVIYESAQKNYFEIMSKSNGDVHLRGINLNKDIIRPESFVYYFKKNLEYTIEPKEIEVIKALYETRKR